MKALPVAILIASALISTTAFAKKPPSSQATQPVALLEQALAAVAKTVGSPDQFNPKVDHDQGDDHANLGAILRVCSKDTPAAQRSAICPVGVSPD
jgi:hypothetical protein